ncbi:MAG: MCE family protein [Xanthomonadales bacterium]|nr:MCE family protein [Gammaproteobacteria bacterium]NNK34227.1 MCE family protein [Xanthomonadales bacterium]NNK37107.1 MCE family protein [Xanthomonadales bacterium]
MFKGDRNFAVGLFVSVAIAAFVAFVLWLTGRSGVEELTRYSLLFQRDVSGLAVGGPVKFMGMNIGSVIQMELERNEAIEVRVDIDILASTPVDGGTYASIALQGITGVAVVNLASEPGSHAPLAKLPGQEHPVIPVRDVGIAAVLSSMPEIMNKLDHLLTQAGQLLGEENRTTISSTLDNVESLSSALAENREAFAAIPVDLRATLADLQSTIGQLDSVITELKPGLGTTLVNVEQASSHLASLTGQLDRMLSEHESDMDAFIADGLGEAPALMEKTRHALRDLEKLMAELKDDPSQLVHRPAVNELEIDP